MKITVTELRAHLYKIADQVIKTGIPVNIERQGHQIMLVLAKPKNKLANLRKHPDTIIGNPDDIVHIDWLFIHPDNQQQYRCLSV